MALTIPADPLPLARDEQGVIRVGPTRVTLDLVVEAYLAGSTPEEIVSQYSSLNLGDVYSVLGFYLRHRTEVDAYLEERRREAEEVRRRHETRWPPDNIRERLHRSAMCPYEATVGGNPADRSAAGPMV
jgi:uncharacterized protein (DUF433 family)